MNLYDFVSICFEFPEQGILLLTVILLSYFVFYSLRRNQYSIYYPFLAIIWFLIIIYDYTREFIEKVLFNNYNMELLFFYYGVIVLLESLIIIGFVSLVIRWWKKPLYEKKAWRECIILSPFPFFLFYSAFVYAVNLSFYLSFIVFIVLVLIDKLILIKHKHYFIHAVIKIIFTLIAVKYMEQYISEIILIVITDCMLGYALLQFISSIHRNKRH